MQHRLKQLAQQAKDSARETKMFFDRLKKRPPKKLDALTQKIHRQTFDQINCMDCANCCKTTGPLFKQQDIKRIARYLRMKAADFEAQFLRIDEDKDWVLQQLPCPFLEANNACTIYDVRPKACREFPHTDRKKIYQIAHLTQKNVAICPAAFDIVEKMKQQLTR